MGIILILLMISASEIEYFGVIEALLGSAVVEAASGVPEQAASGMLMCVALASVLA